MEFDVLTPTTYALYEIDRPLSNRGFNMIDGRGITGTSIEILRRQGAVSILDAGCGTGRALYELAGQVAFRVSADPGVITAVGLNLDDFSHLSEDPRVARAIAAGYIEYRVGSIEDAPRSGQRFDLVYSHEVFMHSAHPDVLLRALAECTAPGGVLYFNVDQPQRAQMGSAVDELRANGWTVSELEVAGFGYRDGDKRRVFYRCDRAT